MIYKIIKAPFSDDLSFEVQKKLNDGWELHGHMTHILYEKDITFYQTMIFQEKNK